MHPGVQSGQACPTTNSVASKWFKKCKKKILPELEPERCVSLKEEDLG
jgi:hypothetical protein